MVVSFIVIKGIHFTSICDKQTYICVYNVRKITLKVCFSNYWHLEDLVVSVVLVVSSVSSFSSMGPCSLRRLAPSQSPVGRSTRYMRRSDRDMIPVTLSSSSTTTRRWTSARTILSITSNKVSSRLHFCTPSNHSLRCSLAVLRETSKLLYVFFSSQINDIKFGIYVLQAPLSINEGQR